MAAASADSAISQLIVEPAFVQDTTILVWAPAIWSVRRQQCQFQNYITKSKKKQISDESNARCSLGTYPSYGHYINITYHESVEVKTRRQLTVSLLLKYWNIHRLSFNGCSFFRYLNNQFHIISFSPKWIDLNQVKLRILLSSPVTGMWRVLRWKLVSQKSVMRSSVLCMSTVSLISTWKVNNLSPNDVLSGSRSTL